MSFEQISLLQICDLNGVFDALLEDFQSSSQRRLTLALFVLVVRMRKGDIWYFTPQELTQLTPTGSGSEIDDQKIVGSISEMLPDLRIVCLECIQSVGFVIFR